MIIWTWAIPIYLWLAGMAGGAYTAAFLADRLRVGREEGLLRAATVLAVPSVIVGSVLLTVELGRPLRFWHLLSTLFVRSPMSVGSWLLLTWPLVGVSLIALWFAEGFDSSSQKSSLLARLASLLRPLVPAIGPLAWIALILSIALITYTGVLLSATNQIVWSKTMLIPALFVVTSISRGVAFLLLYLQLRKRTSHHTLAFLGRADVTLYVIDLVVLVALIIWLGPAGRIITTGTLGLFLWVGVILVGILFPMGVGVRAMIRGGKDGFVSLLAALWAIVGGLILRAVIVMGGQVYG